MRTLLLTMCCLAIFVAGFIVGQTRSVSSGATPLQYIVYNANQIYGKQSQCLPNKASSWNQGSMCQQLVVEFLTKMGEHGVNGRFVTIYHVGGTDQLVFSYGG